MLHAAPLLLALLAAPVDDPLAGEELRALESAVVDAGQCAIEATVGLRVGNGAASGVLVTEDGYIATVGHNFSRPFQRCTVTLFDGRQVDGVTLYKCGAADCGLIKITEEGEYPFVPLGRSDDLVEDQPVLATGHPGGPQRGVPAALRFGSVERNGDEWVRTTCVIMPGDSGGGLLDLEGRLVGICSRIQVSFRVNDSVPIDRLVGAWDRLARAETWEVDGRIRERDPSDEVQAIIDSPPPVPEVQRAADVTSEGSEDAPLEAENLVLPDSARTALRAAAAPITADLARSVVRLNGTGAEGKTTILATAVAPDGLALTKASELGADLVAVLHDDQEAPVSVLATDGALDLALVRVEADLVPLDFAAGAVPAIGALVVSPNRQGVPLEVGVISRPEESVPPTVPGYLGVRLEDRDGDGAFVTQVQEDTAAMEAGLLDGDRILAVDGEGVDGRLALVRHIQGCYPGQRVRLSVLRGEDELVLEAVLRDRTAAEGRGRHAADRAEVSARRDRFDRAVRHDSVIRPHECGGPVVDLLGNLVGLNVARADRTATFILPAEEVARAAAALLEEARKREAPDTEERKVAGWTVHVDTTLLDGDAAESGAKALEVLESHLRQVAVLVPEDRLARLREVEIQVDRDATRLVGMQYHPSRRWLVDNGHAATLAQRVHIPQHAALTSRDLMAVQPRVILHELAHAYHDQVLGFDEPRIRAEYEAAVRAGTYDEVLHVSGEKRRHYALTDHKEYFAEGTEAYFGANDFYPFVRAELARHDPGLHDLLAEIWGDLP